ncbi:Protein kinase-like protein [Penicillium malachiteum]|uniref:Protein kinase-like protein n=1 Tax=Penicillium malachiteum TaxID=1324776 RepID=UPI002546FA55|nr:Protein kinase-like protein [Penicillium malachiteum]KAJ5712845.1 Protein kinase-like protein [Penicillium malachiteum]
MDPLSNFQLMNFFSRYSPITREICDDVVAIIANGGTIKPTPVQGAQSYTVQVGDETNAFIVQFRGPQNTLDFEHLNAAQETYGGLVPTCKNLDQFDLKSMPFSILHHPENFHLLEQTVQDFARFCSRAWLNRPSLPSFNKASIQNNHSSSLDRMMNLLPSRFHPLLDTLESQIPSLFADDYLIVLNRGDVLENNILVDVNTGKLTENILGIRKTTCMAFHPRNIELRQKFWKTLFYEMGDVSEEIKMVIQTARMVGIVLANEFDVAETSEEDQVMQLAVVESMTLGLSDIGDNA